jgi:uncharacterized protein
MDGMLPVLFVVGTAAGWLDSIAGGGGLITVPVLLGMGLSPADALGTNKLQAIFGSGSATRQYGHAGFIDYRPATSGVTFTAIGAFGGALLVQWVRQDVLRAIIPYMLIAIALYFLFRPRVGESEARARMKMGTFNFVFGLTLGFYDGFVGPGTGSLWAMAYVLFVGFGLAKATAHTKLMNFTSNAVALAVFMTGGNVHWVPGLVMGAGQFLGAQVGARMVVTRGVKFIRPIFILVAIAISIRLLVVARHP